ncbi:MAG: POTRA domain-containing protein [Bacteroidota bacterium]
MINWLTYLLEVSICHAFFFLVYYGFLRNLSFFQINRAFLLSITLLGFIVPVLDIPVGNSITSETVAPFTLNLQQLTFNDSLVSTTQEELSSINWLLVLFSIVYFSGVSFRLWKLSSGISKVFKLIRANEITDYKGLKTIYLKEGNHTFFTFMSYLFINTNKIDISSDELNQVIEHEKVHLINKHTIDNLILEFVIALCWFNSILYILKRELNHTHEFFADEVANGNGNKDSYSRLILRLSSSNGEQYLTHQFSMKNIKKRIIMLNKTKNQKSALLWYSIIFPSLIVLLVAFACDYEESVIKDKEQGAKDKYNLLVRENFGSIGQWSSINEVVDTVEIDISKNKLSAEEIQTIMVDRLNTKIGIISWTGNTLYSDEYLSKYIGLKEGESFNEETLNAKLNYNPDGSDLSSLYMDKGYLFFTIEIKKINHEGNVDLVFEINEGDVFTVSEIKVAGNQMVNDEEIFKMISLKNGGIFNRSKLLESQKAIAESGLFDSAKVNPNIIPNPSEKTVEIAFQVSEL